MYVDNFDWIHINVDYVNCSILINEKGCGFQSNFSLWRIRITKYLFFTEKLSFVKIKIKLLYLKFSSKKILSGTEVFFRIQDPSLFFFFFYWFEYGSGKFTCMDRKVYPQAATLSQCVQHFKWICKFLLFRVT